MNTCTTLTLILTLIILIILATLGFTKLQNTLIEKHNIDKARYCHYCHYAYIHRTHEDYVYCPQCGKPLRKIDDNPNIIDTPSTPRNAKTTLVTDFDTWLESQPEGTFVQGGGIDTEEISQNNDKKD